jgi:hypothetical protein
MMRLGNAANESPIRNFNHRPDIFSIAVRTWQAIGEVPGTPAQQRSSNSLVAGNSALLRARIAVGQSVLFGPTDRATGQQTARNDALSEIGSAPLWRILWRDSLDVDRKMPQR